MQFIKTIKEIYQDYDYFIFDIWGVIHDGNQAYEGSIDAVKFLKEANKNICFLSNAPRRSFKVKAVLEKFGLSESLYDFAMSSGEATYLDLQTNQNDGFKNFKQNYFYIGPQKDIDILDGLNYNLVEDASQADFTVATGFDDENSTIEDKLPQIKQSLANNLTMICVNPDMIVVRQNGTKMLCAGEIAKEYKRLGGKVIYYGKPHNDVYKITYNMFANKVGDINKINKKRILAIGDSLETDIKGANAFGIDSLLLTGGILSDVLKIKHDQDPSVSNIKNKLEDIVKQSQTSPKFVISNLKI